MEFLGETLTVLGFAPDRNTEFRRRKLIRTRSRNILLLFYSGELKYEFFQHCFQSDTQNLTVIEHFYSTYSSYNIK